MRIPPGEGSKNKGFGYVEFEDRESMRNAFMRAENVRNNKFS